MKTRLFGLTWIAVVLLATVARAHFVWVVIEGDKSGQKAAQVYFSESAEPDDAALLDKILTLQVTGQGIDGKPQSVTVAKRDVKGGGVLVGNVPADTKSLSAQINYGVLTRRDQTFSLRYHAKYLEAGSDLKKLARDERLVLDVVPTATDKGYSLKVLYKGEPVEGSDFVLIDPAGETTEAKSDAKGIVELATPKPGLYSVRAKWVVAEKGQEGDKEYSQVNHYSTLALRVMAK